LRNFCRPIASHKIGCSVEARPLYSKNSQEERARRSNLLIKKAKKIASSEITPKDVYLNRRKFLMGVSAMAGAAAIGGVGRRWLFRHKLPSQILRLMEFRKAR